MQVGVDFDGTVIRYAICAKQIGRDGHTIITTETLEGSGTFELIGMDFEEFVRRLKKYAESK